MPRLPDWIIATAVFSAGAACAADAPITPVLQKCVACHNATKLSGKLDLTTRKAALERKTQVLVAGKPDQSVLFERVAGREMPPDEPLSEKEIDVVQAWIKDGAKWPAGLQVTKDAQRAGPDWRSLQPLRRPPGPPAAGSPVDPIDA